MPPSARIGSSLALMRAIWGHAQTGMNSLERYAFPRLVKYAVAVRNASLGIILWI